MKIKELANWTNLLPSPGERVHHASASSPIPLPVNDTPDIITELFPSGHLYPRGIYVEYAEKITYDSYGRCRTVIKTIHTGMPLPIVRNRMHIAE